MSTATLTRAPVITAAASYNRNSRFKITEGEMRGYAVTRSPDRQAAGADSYAADNGLGPVKHFTDEGESASRFRRKERTNWPDFLAYIRAGNVTHVLVWLLDRVLRDADETGMLLAACRAGGAVIVQTATRSVIDPNKPEDVAMARVLAAFAEMEVAKMSMRQLSAKADAANAGMPHGGRRRFGYKPGMMKLDKAEAKIVRQLADRFLMGESLYSLANWLTAEGISTANGGKWAGPNMGKFLAGPHLAARRIHQGKDIGPGDWPAIISLETHEAIKAKLGESGRRKSFTNARRYLLAGLAMCQACGTEVRGKPESKRGNPASYVCGTGRHCHRSLADIDAALEALVIGHLSSQRLGSSGVFVDTEAADKAADLQASLDSLPARYDALSDRWAAEEITEAEEKQKRAALDRLADKWRAEMALAAEAARRPEKVLEGMIGAEAAEAWEAATLHRRRAVIDHLMHVFVKGSGRSNRGFDEERDLVIVWR